MGGGRNQNEKMSRMAEVLIEAFRSRTTDACINGQLYTSEIPAQLSNLFQGLLRYSQSLAEQSVHDDGDVSREIATHTFYDLRIKLADFEITCLHSYCIRISSPECEITFQWCRSALKANTSLHHCWKKRVKRRLGIISYKDASFMNALE